MKNIHGYKCSLCARLVESNVGELSVGFLLELKVTERIDYKASTTRVGQIVYLCSIACLHSFATLMQTSSNVVELEGEFQ